jgi:hydroxymethylpyrimidine/phosphomethylpyrimidine kinase
MSTTCWPAQTVLGHVQFELFDAVFAGAGDTLSAALAALLATGIDLGEAASEALNYLDRCLDAGFRPGMGHVVPDRCSGPSPKKTTTTTKPRGGDALAGFVIPP